MFKNSYFSFDFFFFVCLFIELLYTHNTSLYDLLCDTVVSLSKANTQVIMIYEDRGCQEKSFFHDRLAKFYANVEEVQTTTFHAGSSQLIHMYHATGFKGQ